MVRCRGTSPYFGCLVYSDYCRRLPQVAPPFPRSESDPMDRCGHTRVAPFPARSLAKKLNVRKQLAEVSCFRCKVYQSVPTGTRFYTGLTSKYTREPAHGVHTGSSCRMVGLVLSHGCVVGRGGFITLLVCECSVWGSGGASGDHGTRRVTAPLASPARTRNASATGRPGTGSAVQPGPRRVDALVTRTSSLEPSASRRGRMHWLPNIFRANWF